MGAALAVLTGAQLSGAHNYVLMGPDPSGRLRGYNVEATATRQRVDQGGGVRGPHQPLASSPR
ncbi:MAG: hypothetical protein R3A10_21310 [Caldilineaceae bacterium]